MDMDEIFKINEILLQLNPKTIYRVFDYVSFLLQDQIEQENEFRSELIKYIPNLMSE